MQCGWYCGHERRLCGRTGRRRVEECLHSTERLRRASRRPQRRITNRRWHSSTTRAPRKICSSLCHCQVSVKVDKVRTDLEEQRGTMRAHSTGDGICADRICTTGQTAKEGSSVPFGCAPPVRATKTDRGGDGHVRRTHVRPGCVRGRRTATGRYHEICTPQRPFGLRWQGRRRLGDQAWGGVRDRARAVGEGWHFEKRPSVGE